MAPFGVMIPNGTGKAINLWLNGTKLEMSNIGSPYDLYIGWLYSGDIRTP